MLFFDYCVLGQCSASGFEIEICKIDVSREGGREEERREERESRRKYH
jgi:hypothetical protein